MSNRTLSSTAVEAIESIKQELLGLSELEDIDQQVKEIHEFAESDPRISWWGEGSTRTIIVGIGNSIDGQPLTNDGTGVVVKYAVGPMNPAGNHFEASVYAEAQHRGDADLFADVIDHSEDFVWLAMVECTPIYRTEPYHLLNTAEYTIDNSLEYCRELRRELERRGWGGHDVCKHGNHGIDPDGNPVVIDYDSYWTPPGEDWMTGVPSSQIRK